MSKWDELKRLAEAFDDYDWDSNTTPFFNDIEGHSRGGECDGTYVVFGQDFEIDDEQYEGVTLVPRCKIGDAKFICQAKAGVLALIAENERLQAEAERLRMQLAACGVVAMANTPESAATQRAMHPDYMSASCLDVMRAVDREMELSAEVEALRANADREIGPSGLVGDLSTLVGKLVQKLSKAAPDEPLAEKALDYLKRKRLLSPLRAQLGRRALIEAEAKSIYEKWFSQEGYTPWVDGGNSLKQDEARRLAAESIDAAMSKGGKTNG